MVRPWRRRAEILFDMATAGRHDRLRDEPAVPDGDSPSTVSNRPKPMTCERCALILSTGSPLSGESYDYVYSKIKPDVCLSNISGGTDLCACFATGNPTAPVYRGELQTRALGMRVLVYDDAGRPVVGQKGELVCAPRFLRCRWASGAIPRERPFRGPISSGSPASGITAILPSSPNATR